jgi:transcriptional regulator with AAA-type ATPase domain
VPSALESSTLSLTEEPTAGGTRPSAPHLFLVLEGHQPFSSPARFRLDDRDSVAIGRGKQRAFEVDEQRGIRGLTIKLDDAWMSSRHVRLQRFMRRWVLEDEGSKNGCLVNGVARKQAELSDGDLIEIGHTVFSFREAVPFWPEDAAILDASVLRAPAAGLATLIPTLARTFHRLTQVAQSSISVLLQGPTGVGKEVLARAVHSLSRREGDFVAVNCGALPRELVEGELFGHRRGAFSGAIEDRIGLVRGADRGTLFLDEIGDLPLTAQAALLRVLQENEVRPIGGAKPISVDLRVIAATHRPLDRMVEQGEFRADLLNRIAGLRVESPPLAARREDLALLVAPLLQKLDPELAPRVRFHPRATRALLWHAWPGNIRELEKALGTALVLCRETASVEIEHLPDLVQRSLLPPAKRDDDDAAKREALVEHLRRHRGNIAAVARDMGKARMQIQRWLKRFNIDPEHYR